MPTDKTWTMNCVLVGAKALRLLYQGKDEEVKALLEELTSEFEPSDLEYLLLRLKAE